MRIGVFNWRDIRHPKAGGAEEYLHRQARFWLAWNHEVKWFAASFPGAATHEVVEGIEVFRAGGEYTIYAHAPQQYLRHFRDCDVLIDAENGIPFFTPLFASIPKTLLMFHVHRDVLLHELPPPINWITWSMEALALPAIYAKTPMIAISESTRDEVLRYKYTRLPVALIHSGVDHDALGPGPKSDVPTIVYLGRIVRYKRIRELIGVFAMLKNDVPEAVLRIAGRGADMEACKQLAKGMHLEDSIVFEGLVSEARKRELLAQAWAFAQPSRIEGWGISAVEAAACSTPTVAMRVPGLKDAVADGTSGILVDTWDDFARALSYIVLNEAERERLSRGALVWASRFSWEKTARATLNHLQSVIGTPA